MPTMCSLSTNHICTCSAQPVVYHMSWLPSSPQPGEDKVPILRTTGCTFLRHTLWSTGVAGCIWFLICTWTFMHSLHENLKLTHRLTGIAHPSVCPLFDFWNFRLKIAAYLLLYTFILLVTIKTKPVILWMLILYHNISWVWLKLLVLIFKIKVKE
jgi:hypothetical protein